MYFNFVSSDFSRRLSLVRIKRIILYEINIAQYFYRFKNIMENLIQVIYNKNEKRNYVLMNRL